MAAPLTVTFDNKTNNTPIVDRSKQSTAEDWNELKSVANDHASKILAPDNFDLESYTDPDDSINKQRLKDGALGYYYPRYKAGMTAAEQVAEITSKIGAGNKIKLVGSSWNWSGEILSFGGNPGCTLDIEGYVAGGEINFEQTQLIAGDNSVFGLNCTFSGTIKNKKVKAVWFETIDNTGATDASEEINNIIALLTSNQELEFEKGKTYLIENESIVINKDLIILNLNSCYLNDQYYGYTGTPNTRNNQVSCISFEAKSFNSTWYDAEMAEGENKIICPDGTTANVDDLVELATGAFDTCILGARIVDVRTETISAVDKTVITVDTIAGKNYGTGLKLRVHIPIINSEVKNGTITCADDVVKHNQVAIKFGMVSKCKAYGNTMIGNKYAAIGVLLQGNGNKEYNNDIRGFIMRPKIMLAQVPLWGGFAQGYGVLFNGCNAESKSSLIYNCRHAVATVVSYNCDALFHKCGNNEHTFDEELTDDEITATGFHVLDSHESSYNTKFIGIIVTSCVTSVMALRGNGNEVVANSFNVKRALKNGVKQYYYTPYGISINAFTGSDNNNHSICDNNINIFDVYDPDQTFIPNAIYFGGTSGQNSDNILIDGNRINGRLIIGNTASCTNVRVTNNILRGGIITKNCDECEINNNKINYGTDNLNIASGLIGVYFNENSSNITVNSNKFTNLATDRFSNNVAIDAFDVSSVDAIYIKKNEINNKNATGYFNNIKISTRSNITNYVSNENLYQYNAGTIIKHPDSGLYPVAYNKDGSLVSYSLDIKEDSLFEKTIDSTNTFTLDIDGIAAGHQISFNIWANSGGTVALPSPLFDLSSGVLTVKSFSLNYDNTLFTKISVLLIITSAGADITYEVKSE